MELTGKIISIGETQKVGEKQFPIREFVLETEENYPQKLPIRVTGDKVTELDGYSVGQSLTVKINLKGREWKGKYFVNIEAWNINAADQGNPQQAVTQEQEDLPF